MHVTAAACSVTTPTFTFREKATRRAERQEKAARVRAAKAARRVRVSKAKYDEARRRYDDDKKAEQEFTPGGQAGDSTRHRVDAAKRQVKAAKASSGM